MEKKKIIEQLITTEAWLEGTLKNVRKSRKLLEGVDLSAPPGGMDFKEEAAANIARNMNRRRKRA